MVVMAWAFFGGGRPVLRVWLGLALGFAGAALLIRQPATAAEGSPLTGSVLLALAPVCWSLGSLLTQRSPPSGDALLTSAMQMLTGGGLMLLLGTCLGEWPLLLGGGVGGQGVSARSVLAFLYLSLIGGLVGFSVYAWLLRNASPSAVSTYAYVNPLVAVLLGRLGANEEVDGVIAAAAALVLGAVVLITWPAKAAAVAVKKEVAAEPSPSLLTRLGLLTGGRHRRRQRCEREVG
jgi:drug/metabolite transporter (DMT)-like permease